LGKDSVRKREIEKLSYRIFFDGMIDFPYNVVENL
jgi:hypothetical protein